MYFDMLKLLVHVLYPVSHAYTWMECVPELIGKNVFILCAFAVCSHVPLGLIITIEEGTARDHGEFAYYLGNRAVLANRITIGIIAGHPSTSFGNLCR